MFCAKCKKENKDDASFCVHCGMTLPKEAGISRSEMANGGDEQDGRKKEVALEATPEPEGAGAGAMWDYKHVFIGGATARESGEGVSRATMPMVGRYEPSDIQQRLQEFGRDGWELVCMEPQWFWERVGVSMAAEITRPRVIAGWYCTFKRRVSAT
jgi:hypothetical protein